MSRRILPLLFLISGMWALEGAPVRVGVSLLPLESLVREIGGGSVEVMSLQREGDSCSVFEPRPSSITWLSGAELFFRIGAGYEPVIIEKLRSQFPGMRIIDLREGVDLLDPVADDDHHHHGHDHECDHGPDGGDPHIWLDPVRLQQLAESIAGALAQLNPGQAAEYVEAAGRFNRELARAHDMLTGQLEKHRGKAFYIYHPALVYFADRYGLRQIAIAESGQGPTIRQMHELITRAREAGVKTVFVQPQESRRHAEIVAEAIGAKVVEIDPMSTDLVGNLLVTGQSLAESFNNE